MNEVLYILCGHSVSIMDGWHPIPSTLIAKRLGRSLYSVRKDIKKLKEKGYVQSCRECVVTEDGNYILNGYTITKKAEETEEYKKEFEKEKILRKEVFGFDI